MGERLRYTHVVGGIDAACGGERERDGHAWDMRVGEWIH